MKIGTKSLLWGAHQFLLHPLYVYRAWRWLYVRRPSWWELLCILVHDWGYWGLPDMDGDEGLRHPVRGAEIAATLVRWFGGNDILQSVAYQFVLKHSRSYAAHLGVRPSALCWADKLGTAMELERNPISYLRRTTYTGELAEYRWLADLNGFLSADETDETWASALAVHHRRKAIRGARPALMTFPARQALMALLQGGA